jgi:hypothetical protein
MVIFFIVKTIRPTVLVGFKDIDDVQGSKVSSGRWIRMNEKSIRFI